MPADSLTTRELAAIHLAAAFIVTPHALNGRGDRDERIVAKFAVAAADALIAELNKERADDR